MNGYIVTYKNQSFYSDLSNKPMLTLEDLYSLIGTNIVERIDVSVIGKPYTAWFCEEGKLRDLEPNVALFHQGDVYDFLAGTVVLTEYDEEHIRPLTQESYNHLTMFGKQSYVGTIHNPFTDTTKFAKFPLFYYYQG